CRPATIACWRRAGRNIRSPRRASTSTPARPRRPSWPSSASSTASGCAASILAEGLDVVVATDHNTVSGDWQAAIAELHAARPLGLIVGDEVSLERFGHFAVIPVPHGGAPEVRGRPPREVLRSLHGPGRVVIVEHPRGGGRSGYFENVGIDEK